MIDFYPDTYFIPDQHKDNSQQYIALKEFLYANGYLFLFSQALDSSVVVHVNSDSDIKIIPFDASASLLSPDQEIIHSLMTVFDQPVKPLLSLASFSSVSQHFDYLTKSRFYEAILSLGLVVDTLACQSTLYPYDKSTESLIQTQALKNKRLLHNLPEKQIELIKSMTSDFERLSSKAIDPISFWTSYSFPVDSQTIH